SSWITRGGEQGLLSMAFAPDYAASGRFYIDYTAAGTGALTVDEVQRDASDPNVADPSTRRNVISVPHPTYSNHNGGQLQFGPVDRSWGAGANFAWGCLEGRHPYNTCNPPPFAPVPPVFEYDHSTRCSITGGYVVRDPELTLLDGQYLYGDFCDGEIRSQLLD